MQHRGVSCIIQTLKIGEHKVFHLCGQFLVVAYGSFKINVRRTFSKVVGGCDFESLDMFFTRSLSCSLKLRKFPGVGLLKVL